MPGSFRVGVTRDFLKPDGSHGFGDVGLSRLDAAPGVLWEFLPEKRRELLAEDVSSYDALLVLSPLVTAASVSGADRLAVVARFGVGWDSVDAVACTHNGTILTITPDGVRRPVAAAAMTFVLALAHRLPQKDRLTREGRWSQKLDYMGTGLTGRTLGLVGFGNIGREIARLALPFDLQVLASDPHVDDDAVRAAGATPRTLDALLAESDFVVICCSLAEDTRHLINAARLARMRPTAFLVNVARGPIVDQKALTAALAEGRIAGAGIDVFEEEPVDPADPLLSLDNVIVSPHALCWTDECVRGIGHSAIDSILAVAEGRVPRYVVNREALETPRFQAKLARFARVGEAS